jgi:AAA15 family ATPase/GTPase
MNLRFLALALLLILSVSVVFAEDAVEKEIDCAKDCADFVSAVAQKEKAAVEDKLSQCQKSNEELKKEHDETVASLKAEVKLLQEHTEKAAAAEKELRELNKQMEKKFTVETEQQKKMMLKASELAQKSQQEVIEAKMELQKIIETMSTTRINFKLIGEDIAGIWKKIMEKIEKLMKKDDETKADL